MFIHGCPNSHKLHIMLEDYALLHRVIPVDIGNGNGNGLDSHMTFWPSVPTIKYPSTLTRTG